MKPERMIFWFIAVFFGVVTPIYWLMAKEIAGTFVLGFAGLLGALIAGYLTITARSFDARPEDRRDAEVYEAAGEVGFFPPHSMWPAVCALVFTMVFLGPGLEQAWITILALGIAIWAVSGWVLEYYRGDYQH